MHWLVLAFCAGAVAVQFLPVLPAPGGLLASAMVGIIAWPRWPVIAAAMFGLAWTAFGARQILADDRPCSRDREIVDLNGVVAAPAIRHEGRVEFDFRVLEPAASAVPRMLRLSWYEAGTVPLPGQQWRLTVRLRCRNGFANPGAPDRELELLRQGLGATGYVASKTEPVLLTDRPWQFPVQRLRARIAAEIAESGTSNASAAVLQGLAVGVRGNVPEELWEAFAATGIAHLMAISGMHVTGLAVCALLLLRTAWKMWPGIPGSSRIVVEMTVVVAATASYAMLAGASLPTLRTLVTVVFVALQRLLRRATPVHLTLSLAALLLVAADPLAVATSGFWLSFVATAVLMALLTAGNGWPGHLKTFLRTQVAILLLLTPVLAIAFGRLSLVAPFANGIAVPIFSFLLLPVVLFATTLAGLAPGSGGAIWHTLSAILDACWPWLIAAGQLKLATWWPASQPTALIVAAGVAGFVALLVPVGGLRAAAAAMLVAIVLGRARRPADDSWILTTLDVGQGLAVVVETRNHVLVFDTGPRWNGVLAAARVSLIPWLHARGIRHIDRLVLSHDDSDHTGGSNALLDALPVTDLLVGPRVNVKAPSRTCRRGEQWRWDGIDFRVLHPGLETAGSDNDNSCVLRIAGAGGSALLLADTEAVAEEELLLQSLAADVVLLPHHGSRTSSGPRFVEAVGARLGIVSAGFGNRWNLPDPGVIARWRAAGTTVLNTADLGAVAVHFTALPGEIEIEAQRLESRRWWRRDARR